MDMFTVSMITLAVSLSLIWFFIIIYVGKNAAGKTPPGSVVILFLLLSGPIGWAILAIAWMTDMVEKFSKKH